MGGGGGGGGGGKRERMNDYVCNRGHSVLDM